MRSTLLLAVALLLFAETVCGKTWIVAEDGSGDATDLDIAMGLASVRDTLLVQPGTYGGEVWLTRDITMIGSGADVTTCSGIILCSNGGHGVGSLIQGFTLAGSRYGPALLLAGYAEVRECVVRGATAADAAIEVAGEIEVYDTVFAGHADGVVGDDVGAMLLKEGSALVERSVFEGHSTGLIRVLTGDLEVRNSVIRNNRRADLVLDERHGTGPIHALLEDNLFVDNDRCWVRAWNAEILGNTFARSQTDFFCGSSTSIERNLFTAARWGLRVWGVGDGPAIRCNNSWGNTTNWWGIPRASEEDGNISVDPLLCDPDNDDFSVAVGSPCIPFNNPCGGQIGAFGQGCSTVSVSTESWARLKARYR